MRTHYLSHRSFIAILLIILTLPPILQFQAGSSAASESTPPAISQPQVVYPPFTNPAAINIPENFAGTAVSTINVTGVLGNITNITITLNGGNHTFSDDINILVIGPGGQAVILWSDTRGSNDLVNANITFQDGGPVQSDGNGPGAITGNVTFAPTNHVGTCAGQDAANEPDLFPAPGPGTAYTPSATLAAAFVGLSGAAVNGTWTLYAVDDCPGDTGGFNGGWAINLTDDASTPLAANTACNLNNLEVNITDGDGPFNITGTGPGLPLNGVAAGTHPLNGPSVWSNITVTETAGNTETLNFVGPFDCGTIALAATAVCNLDNLDVTITAGDTPFNITGTGPGLPLNGVSAGTYPLTGPGPWTGVTVTEVGGNGQSTNLGTFNCATNGLTVSATCVGNNLVIALTAGDSPFNITGTGPGLPINGATWANIPLFGPGSWTGVTITETAGNLESTNLGNFNCSTSTLTATAVCTGPNLVVTISGGDAPFNIVGTGPGLPQNGVTAGNHTLTGPATWTAIDVAEAGGNLEVATLGNFTCTVAPPPPPPPIIPGIPVPNLGLIMIDTGQAQFALQSPNGQPIALSNGTPVLLPADADHSGYDTYTVTGIYWIDGEYWLSIFLGNTTWGWVPLDLVTPLTPLELPEPAADEGTSKP